MSELTLRERILLGIIASGITLSIFVPSCDPKPQMPHGYDERERIQ